jgi:hypothetical protein
MRQVRAIVRKKAESEPMLMTFKDGQAIDSFIRKYPEAELLVSRAGEPPRWKLWGRMRP